MKNGLKHISVEAGVDAGRGFTIPPEGARIGRSSNNDIVLIDPMLSRHHCRFFFKDNGLWVADLGSANDTLLNQHPITEAPVYSGNHIMIGETVLKVEHDGRNSEASAAGTFDLGLQAAHANHPGKRATLRLKPAVIAVLSAILVVGAAWWMLKPNPPQDPTTPASRHPPPPRDRPLLVDYEKIDANPENIFRYQLSFSPDRELTITIDDVVNHRSVRKQKSIGAERISDLVRFIENAGFSTLEPQYHGLTPGVLEERSLTIGIGRDVHTVQVRNRTAPEIFNSIAARLESFGKVELGLWAIEYSTPQLIAMAEEAMLQGRKLASEREVGPGNLAAAISSFNEAEWLLDSVEIKPDFHADMLAARQEAIEALEQRYKVLNFKAERAIRLRDWDNAAAELQMLLEVIPDRDDPRHEPARQQLLEIEARRNPRK